VENESGDVLGALARDLRYDRDVGVGGEHDAGMPELFLHDFEVGSGLQGEAGRTVPQVVQPDGRQTAGGDEFAEVDRQSDHGTCREL
jgi:hypothetical protein